MRQLDRCHHGRGTSKPLDGEDDLAEWAALFSFYLLAYPTVGWAAFRDIVFRSPTLPVLGRRTEEYGLSDRQSTDASDRAVDSRVVLIGTNDRFQHFWRRTC
jgi:hypothetical protein